MRIHIYFRVSPHFDRRLLYFARHRRHSQSSLTPVTVQTNESLPLIVSFRGMNSIGSECNDLKKEYDSCFNVWYSESFLKGDYKSDPCSELLKNYRTCVLVNRFGYFFLMSSLLKIPSGKAP